MVGMQRGDLLLYASSGVWYERAIVLATHGPFVHVAIVVSDALVVSARGQGIGCDPCPPEDSRHVVVQLAGRGGLDREAGLTWALEQQGKAYGWTDIVYQGLKFLAPNNPFRFHVAGHMDCSDYASRYLQHCGYIFPDDFADPYANTPNDIARLFGLLAPRKGTSIARPREGVPT